MQNYAIKVTVNLFIRKREWVKACGNISISHGIDWLARQSKLWDT